MNYSKNDVDSLTVKELNAIVKSNFLNFYNRKCFYDDMSKYARLGMWILNSLGAEIDSIDKLIGEYPTIEDSIEIKRELTEEEEAWIKYAEANNMRYKITKDGIKLG